MSKTKILIVDDDEPIREYFKRAFTLKGFEVVTANNGVEGFTVSTREQPQLILADVKMPEMDGIEMLKKIRESGNWGARVPVIILSNFDVDEDMMKGVLEGDPSFYLLKSETTPDTIISKFKEIAK